MPRRQTLGNNKLNLLDKIAGCELQISYRMPTTKERQAFLNSKGKRQGNDFIDNTVEARILAGSAVITGLRDGDFERVITESELKELSKETQEKAEIVGEAVYLPISTDPKSPCYLEDWKDWMEEHAPDILIQLCVLCYEMPAVPLKPKSNKPKLDAPKADSKEDNSEDDADLGNR